MSRTRAENYTYIDDITYLEQLITRDQVKTYLQVSDTSLDTLIDTYLEAAEQAAQHYTNNSWDIETGGETTNASATIEGIDSSIMKYLSVGNLVKIEAQGIERAVITVVDKINNSITIDTAATATDTEAELVINTFPTAYKPTLARMINHNIKSTKSTASPGELRQESIGTYSYQLGDGGSELDGYGYPKGMITGMKAIKRPRFK